MIIRTFKPHDTSQAIALWRENNLIVPWNDPHKDIKRKLGENPELFFVGETENKIIATCMAGYDGHRGWIYYLSVAKEYQSKGYGKMIVQHAENELKKVGCPKIELMVRESNVKVIDFYHHIGYTTEPVKVLGKRLIND